MFDKLKQLSKDTAIYGVSTILGRFLTFLLVPFYTNVFPAREYGIVSNLYVFVAIFNVVFIFGMDASYLKFGSNIIIGDEKDNFSTPFLSVLSISAIICAAILLLRYQILWTFDIPTSFIYLMYYVVAILLIDNISVLPFIKLRLERKAKKFAFYKIINILVNVTLNLYLILKLKWGIEAVFFSNLAASIISLVILLPDIFRSLRFKFNKELLPRLLKFGLPYLPAGLAAMLIQGIDRPIITHLTDLSTSGLYSANYKLGIFMLLFVNMFQYAWQPFFLQTAQEENAKEVFSKVLTYFTLVAAVVLVVVSLFISDVAHISIHGHTIIGKEYLKGLVIVPVVLLGYLFSGMYGIFTAGIYIKEKSIYVPVMTAIGAFVNIALNYLLIPTWNIMGAAMATLLAYFVMAVGYLIITQRFYKINYEYGKITKIFISVAVVAVIYYVQYFGGYLSLLNKFLMFSLFLILLAIFNVGKDEVIFLKKRYLDSKVKP
jgi:O-antigen/teichoic acid export membrane protein